MRGPWTRTLFQDWPAAFPLFALALTSLFTRGTPWAGDDSWTIDQIAGAVGLVGPGVAALGAYVTWREAGRRPLLATLRRRRAVGLVLFLRAGLPGLFAIAAGGLVALATTSFGPHGGPLPLWVLGLVPVTVGWYAAAGLLVGAVVDSVAVVPIAAVLTFAVGTVGQLGVIPNVVRQGPSTGSLDGLAWRLDTWLATGGVLIASAALLILLAEAAFFRESASASEILRPTVVLGLSSCLVAATVWWSHVGSERFRFSHQAASTCTTVRGQPFCVFASSSRWLPVIASDVGPYVERLQEAGVTFPARYVQISPDGAVPAGAGFFGVTGNHSFEPGAAAQLLLQPAACSFWFDGPPESVSQASFVLWSWLTVDASDGPVATDDQLGEWLKSPAEKQAAWVRSAYADLTACDTAALHVPWEGS